MIRRFINKTIWLVVHKVPWKPILIWGPWVVVILGVIFYTFENWRGRTALTNMQSKAEATGVSMRYQDYLPKRSDESPSIGSLPGFDSRTLSGVFTLARGGRANLDPSPHYSDLNRWQAKPDDIRNWLLSPPATQKETAIELSSTLAPEISLFNELKKEVAGKNIVFEFPNVFEFEDFSNPHGFRSLGVARFAREDFQIAISLHETERALDDIEFLIKLAEAKTFPNFIEMVSKIVFWKYAEQSIWEAVLSKQLNREQLAFLFDQLNRYDGLKSLQEAICGEMAFNIATMEEFEKDRQAAINQNFFFHRPSGSKIKDTLWEWTNPIRLRCAPNGWFQLDTATFIEYYLPLTSSEVTDWNQFDTRLSRAAKIDTSSRVFKIPESFNSLIDWFLMKQKVNDAGISLARTGLALELFRHDQKTYPETLSQLGTSIPEDPFSGKRIQYRKLADGSPLLWSVGLNLIDEGGLPQVDTDDEGDIVWQLTPVAGLTESDLKKKLRKHRLKGGASL